MQISWGNTELLDKYSIHLDLKELETSIISLFDKYSLREVSVIFVENSYIQNLNKEYRGKDEATDVLSFNLDEGEGEIYLSLEYISQNTKDFLMEVLRMIVHGLLHIVGYDHKTYFYEDNHDEEMYTIQEDYLSQIYKVMKK